MKLEITNPISRLYNILYDLKQSSAYNPYTRFAEVINIDSSDVPEILFFYADLLKLCNDSKTLSKNIILIILF